MVRPKRREREIEQARLHILQAAASVFAQKGYKAASIKEIAQKADYSAPSLYRYFPGKKAILEVLVENFFKEFETLFKVSFPSGLIFSQRLEFLLSHQYAWIEERRNEFIFLTRQQNLIDSMRKTPGPNVVQGHIQRMTTWLSQNSSANDLNGCAHETAAYVLWGISKAFFSRWMRDGAKDSLQDQIPEILHFFFYGVGSPLKKSALKRKNVHIFPRE